MNTEFQSAFQNHLLSWYRVHKRKLPWRESQDPYRIWVAEVMLQQTRIDQALPYFERFTAAFPDVFALAGASLSQVLKTWEGMGYYARARNMHRAAQLVVEKYSGQIPDTMEEISELPGIGPYTAAAVLSIAYNRDYAVLDGNVTRVLCRVFRIEEDSPSSAVKKELLRISKELLRKGEAADFNQAMMELGALICTPKAPQCPSCPLRALCRAQELEDPSSLPVKPPKKPKPHYEIGAGIIWRDSRILIAQRPLEGLLGGLWEFPGGKREPGETLEECVRREIREELDIEVAVDRPFLTVKHAYTHFRITLHAFHCTYLSGEPKPLECADWRWVHPEALEEYAFPRADRKLLETLLGKDAPPTQVV